MLKNILLFASVLCICYAAITDIQVYHGAPNTGLNYSTLQNAVNYANSNGYACSTGNRVRINIQASETEYGSGAGNTGVLVLVGCGIILNGEMNGDYPGAKIVDQIMFTNSGSDTGSTPWGWANRTASDVFWAHGGLLFIQNAASSLPCVYYDYYEPIAPYGYPYPFQLFLKNCVFINGAATTNAPLVTSAWDGTVLLMDCILESASTNQYLLYLHRTSGVELFNSELSGKLFIYSQGTGSTNPNTIVDVIRNDIAYISAGDVDSAIYVLNMNTAGPSFVQFYGNDILQLVNPAHTSPQYMLFANSGVNCPHYYAGNEYELNKNAGTVKYLYYAPSTVELNTGRNSAFSDSYTTVFAGVVRNAVSV